MAANMAHPQSGVTFGVVDREKRAFHSLISPAYEEGSLVLEK
jgi:hypothetical protein